MPDRNVTIARELTKIHEEFVRGTAKEIYEKVQEPKGEYIIIIDSLPEPEEQENMLNELTLEEHYKVYESQGMNKKEIIKQIAKDRNVNKNEIYMYFI